MDTLRTQELIHAELDGELTAAERAELARLLLQDPEARHLQDDLRRTHGLLREIPQAEPPAGLRSAILAALGLTTRAEAPASGRSGRWSGYRLAAAIIGSLVVAGIGYSLLDVSQPGADLQGSVGAAIPSTAVAGGTSVDQALFQSDGIEASATLHRSGQGLRLDLELLGTVPYEVVASFDPVATTFLGADGDADLAELEGAIIVQAGPGRVASSLEFSGTAPIVLQVRAGDQVLGEDELSPGPSN
jgi:hypothetical protein